jgi:signal recognition particle receptor subunit beta
MVQLNHARREITLKLVYDGPALSGKTANLRALHRLVDPGVRGWLMTLDTLDGRTLFLDALPLSFKSRSGFHVKIKLYTVPGEVMHKSTRDIVLCGADGVCFIADSQRSRAKANNEAWRSMHESLRQSARAVPIAIQFNKRDLNNVRTDAEIEEIKLRSPAPVLTASAVSGEGVLDTLRALLRLTHRSLNAQHDVEGKLGLSEAEFLGALCEREATAQLEHAP